MPKRAEEQQMFLSVRELGLRWGTSRTRTYDLIGRPDFPDPMHLGHVYRFRIDEVEAWERAQTKTSRAKS